VALVVAHDELLKRLNMDSLEHRRFYLDSLWCYKLLFVLVHVNGDNFFTLRSSYTRGHPYKISRHVCNRFIRFNFFSERAINL